MGLRKALLTDSRHAIVNGLKSLAKHFEYNYASKIPALKNVPMISNGSMVLIALLSTAGELASSRSPREFKENLIQRNSIDAAMFFGTPALMALFNKGATTVQGAIKQAVKSGKTHKALVNAAEKAAGLYGLSFLLNLLVVSGVVIGTNRMTIRGLKKAVNELDTVPAKSTERSADALQQPFITQEERLSSLSDQEVSKPVIPSVLEQPSGTLQSVENVQSPTMQTGTVYSGLRPMTINSVYTNPEWHIVNEQSQPPALTGVAS